MNFKKILALVVVICLIAVVMAATVSCGAADSNSANNNNDADNSNNNNNNNTNNDGDNNGENDDQTEYVDHTVTFVNHLGASVEGVVFELTYGDQKTDEATSGANGTAVVKIPKSNLEYVYVNVLDANGYGVPTQKNANRFVFGTTSIEMQLLPAVTVTILDTDNNPVANVGVQICYGSVCRQAAPTDENGKLVSYFIPEGTMTIKIPEEFLPDGYVLPDVDENGYCATFEDGAFELTFILEKE